MTQRKPINQRERRRGLNHRYGHRAVCNWGDGDLPAPFAEGDLVHWDGTPNDRLRGQQGPYFVVTYCCSIDEGDAWYARVREKDAEFGSDRLHMAWPERSSWDEAVNWMEGFTLIETSDPEGLAKREQMLSDGWTFTPPPTCPTCGQTVR